MEMKPFTREQAEKIASDFQHLVGKNVHPEVPVPINYIIIGPLNEDQHYAFARYHWDYHELTEYDDTIPSNEYDVLAIAWFEDSGKCFIRNIRQLCTDHGISYIFP